MSVEPRLNEVLENTSYDSGKSVVDLIPIIMDLQVNTQEDYEYITSIYSNARKCQKHLEEKRKQIGEPLRRELEIINDKAREVSEPLSKIISLCNEKTSSYMKMLEISKKSREESVREAASMFDLDVYIPPDDLPKSKGAQVITKIVKKHRVIDINKVPRKYLMIDEDAIKKDISLGINLIEGLEIYSEEKISLRASKQ